MCLGYSNISETSSRSSLHNRDEDFPPSSGIRRRQLEHSDTNASPAREKHPKSLLKKPFEKEVSLECFDAVESNPDDCDATNIQNVNASQRKNKNLTNREKFLMLMVIVLLFVCFILVVSSVTPSAKESFLQAYIINFLLFMVFLIHVIFIK